MLFFFINNGLFASFHMILFFFGIILNVLTENTENLENLTKQNKNYKIKENVIK